MTKTYYKKENITIWYLLLLLVIGLIAFGYILVKYIVWQVIPLLAIAILKIQTLKNNHISPIIALDDKGLTTINPKLGNQFYAYDDISAIHLNSKSLNGYIKVKSKKNKKIRLDTVAIDLIDQREIENLVNSKIQKS